MYAFERFSPARRKQLRPRCWPTRPPLQIVHASFGPTPFDVAFWLFLWIQLIFNYSTNSIYKSLILIIIIRSESTIHVHFMIILFRWDILRRATRSYFILIYLDSKFFVAFSSFFKFYLQLYSYSIIFKWIYIFITLYISFL